MVNRFGLARSLMSDERCVLENRAIQILRSTSGSFRSSSRRQQHAKKPVAASFFIYQAHICTKWYRVVNARATGVRGDTHWSDAWQPLEWGTTSRATVVYLKPTTFILQSKHRVGFSLDVLKFWYTDLSTMVSSIDSWFSLVLACKSVAMLFSNRSRGA